MSARVWRLDRDAVLARLTDWAGRLGEDPNVLAVVLFGSLARGDATAASDADVLIMLRESPEDFGERLVRFKPVGLGVSVEVFPYTLEETQRALSEGWGVVGVALKEGKVLFGRENELEGLLRTAPRDR
ncbi:MAG: nucleotidyltransferase domain-containing protein [Actinomycetota bacterium]